MQISSVHLFRIALDTFYVVFGLYAIFYPLWGLVTGGPRAVKYKDKAYLYDRVYFAFDLVTGFGVAGLILGLVEPESQLGSHLFSLSTGLFAVGSGFKIIMRSAMMVRASDYYSRHGFVLNRLHHAWLANRLGSWGLTTRRVIGGFTIAAGCLFLSIGLPYVPDILAHVVGSLAILKDIFA